MQNNNIHLLDTTNRTPQTEIALTLFRSLLDHTNDTIEIIDPETGKFLDVNKKACMEHGYTREEYLTMTVSDIAPNLRTVPWKEISAQAKAIGSLVVDGEHQRKDGTIFPVEVNITYIQQEQDYILAIVRDISERKHAIEEQLKLEKQLQHSRKIEAIGRLAGGIAHDFNNMLTVIIGYAELTLGYDNLNPIVKKNLTAIYKSAKHSAEITKQLLAFARKQTISPIVLNLNDALKSMMSLLHHLIGEDIDLIMRIENDLELIKFDKGQIDQILVNLTINARDAISDVGKITIETQNVILSNEFFSIHSNYASGEYVLLKFSDTGCGIEKEKLSQIFEPFFTTKDTGKGTGLGLATVYGIMEQNNGFIKVFSEPGKGASFEIYFPAYKGEKKKMETKVQNNNIIGKGEGILVIEDEEPILNMVKEMLKNLGFSVYTTMNSTKALQIAKKHQNNLKLIITDIIMPEENGYDLSKTIFNKKPDIKCIYMSGYNEDVITSRGILKEGINFIQKPFSIHDLSALIKKVLFEK